MLVIYALPYNDKKIKCEKWNWLLLPILRQRNQINIIIIIININKQVVKQQNSCKNFIWSKVIHLVILFMIRTRRLHAFYYYYYYFSCNHQKYLPWLDGLHQHTEQQMCRNCCYSQMRREEKVMVKRSISIGTSVTIRLIRLFACQIKFSF